MLRAGEISLEFQDLLAEYAVEKNLRLLLCSVPNGRTVNGVPHWCGFEIYASGSLGQGSRGGRIPLSLVRAGLLRPSSEKAIDLGPGKPQMASRQPLWVQVVLFHVSMESGAADAEVLAHLFAGQLGGIRIKRLGEGEWWAHRLKRFLRNWPRVNPHPAPLRLHCSSSTSR